MSKELNLKIKKDFMTHTEKINYIISNYEKMTAFELSHITNLSLTSVQRIAWRNGLHKNNNFLNDFNVNDWFDIKDFSKYLINKEGVVIRKKDKFIISHTYTKDKYHCVKLVSDLGLRKSLRVHRLVALTFLLNPNNLPEVNHKDGNKDNNNVENLEWISSSDNQKHAYENNLRLPANINYSINDIEKICEYIESGKSTKEIIFLMDSKFSEKQINRIKRKETWVKISNKYNF